MDKTNVAPSRSAVRLAVRGLLAAAVVWLGGWVEKAGAAFTANLDSYDTSIWTKADGWTNGGFFNVGWKADHITFSGGLMTIRLDNVASSGRPYSSGEYRTNAKYGYGRVEGTFKTVRGSGIVTSLFTYTGPNEGDPWDEIDIEILGKDPTKMQCNYFTNGVGHHETLINLGFDSSAGFHSYAFEWSPSSIKWFVKQGNGSWLLVHTENGSRGPLPTHPGKIIANMWAFTGADTSWTGPFSYTGPLYAQYDQIYYGPAGTSGSGGAVADTTPPSVSGVYASGITASAATIGWTSNEPTYSQVEYGTSLSYGKYGAFSGSLLTGHSSALSGLAAGTLYHYRIRSWDAANNMGLSGDYTFTTGASGSTGSTSFSDNFNSGVPTGWTPISGNWSVSGGIYGQTNTALYRALTTAGSTWGDVSVSASMNVISGGQDLNQIILRYIDANNYVAAFISKYWGCIGLEQMQGGVRSYSQVAFSFPYNTWFTMKAVAKGNQAYVYFNGALMRSWTLPNGTTKGKIGLGNSVSTARFDNIVATAGSSGTGTLSPTATITSLANGAIVGTSIKVTASGSDDEGVARVELLADGAVAASQDFSPAVPSFTTSLAWSTLAIGTHRLQVVTYDSEGNRGESPAVSITVSNKAGSQVSLVSTQSLEQPATLSEQAPRALMMSLQQSRGAALAFSEDVEEAAVLDLHGRAVMHQRKQGNAILMSFQQSSGGRLPMESGLWLIQMKDKDGQVKVKPLMVVK